MDQQAAVDRTARRKQLLQAISAAVDGSVPIRPLQELITQYAEFMPRWTALKMPAGSPDFEFLSAITAYDDGRTDGPTSFLLADWNANQIYRIGASLDNIVTIDIYAAAERVHTFDTIRRPFCWPTSIRADPTRRGCFFMSGDSSVRIINDGAVSLIAGQDQSDGKGSKDGIGSDAKFGQIMDIIPTPDGRMLYVADCGNNNCLIRAVDVTTGAVITILDDDRFDALAAKLIATERLYPRRLALNNNNSTDLFIVAATRILRFDIKSGKLQAVDLKMDGGFRPLCIACMTNGTIVFNCGKSNAVYAANPQTGDVELVGQRTNNFGHRYCVFDIYIDEPAQCIFAIHRDCVNRIAAPPHLFWK
jgi:hypothetical protein